MIRDRVRRWLKLHGPGGLANVLMAKDADVEALQKAVREQADLINKLIPQLNRNSATCARVAVYETQVPGIARCFRSMQEKAIRERRRQEATAALAAQPSDPAPPNDAVADDLSEQVAGG
jgi:hypothetical protein